MMNEVRQAWSSLRSPGRSSSLAAGGNNNHGGSTTWYDAPAPVIIHCRDFSEDETATGKATADATDDEARIAAVAADEIESRAEEALYENGFGGSSKCNKQDRETNDARNVTTRDQEVLYENNVEAALNSLSKVCSTPSNSTDLESSDTSPEVRGKGKEKNVSQRRRVSSTVEIKATTIVKTNPDGMPVISFSFLQTDDKRSSKNLKSDIPSGSVDEDREESPEDQLYDIPKNSEDKSVDKSDACLAANVETSDRKISPEVDDAKDDVESTTVPTELYDVPKSSNENSTDLATVKSTEVAEIATRIDSSRLKNYSSSVKRSCRSLKSGRRSFGATDDDDDDVGANGVDPTSGSYSDPECPEVASSGRSSSRGERLGAQRRRLGKAWGRMRSWLRDERTKIGEVVARHARMQAVGALNGDVDADERVAPTTTTTTTTRKCLSYDLTKARARELGSITRVEEFGLTSVTEECREPDRASSKSPDSGKPSANERSRRSSRSTLRKKTASSDDILGDGKRSRLACASLSLDKLCPDPSERAVVVGVSFADVDVDATTSSSSPREEHAVARGGGLIRRRMLGSIRGLMASTHLLQAHEHDEGGQGGFEDVRRYIKQGGDFCKELAAILHERAELEATYAKGLSKLSSKLTKACAKDQGGNSGGGVNEAWRCVGEEMEAAAEAHRVWGMALSEQLAKPLRIGVAEAQGRSRKSIENSVDKASKSLQEWRAVASKSKKQSFSSARENERLQDLARLQSISQNQHHHHHHNNNNNKSSHHMTEKEASKLETRRRKAEDTSRRADTEFYTVSVRAERARLEYESTVRKGAKQMELLEEERLSALKDFANVYLAHLQALAPRLQQSADRLSNPVRSCSVSQDVEILKNLIRRIEGNDTVNGEQLLPDFYAEHITLAMNRERRKQALVRVLHLIRQDLERERRGREGLETLHRAFIKTPAFAADESTQNVTEKLHHMRSMLMYLEAARYKVSGTLAEVEGSKRGTHPLAEHILVSRDKQGLQQSVLKIPSWAKNESFEFPDSQDELEVHLSKDHVNESRDWTDRTAGDGNSENPPDEEDFSDFDDFSSQSEDNNNQDVEVVDVTAKVEGAEQCRAIYEYSANLNDELSLSPGDLITIHQKQADGWWIGECRGRTGIFPATYVQVIH